MRWEGELGKKKEAKKGVGNEMLNNEGGIDESEEYGARDRLIRT